MHIVENKPNALHVPFHPYISYMSPIPSPSTPSTIFSVSTISSTSTITTPLIETNVLGCEIKAQKVFIHENMGDDLLKCKICRDVFISSKDFNNHAIVEHEMKYLCNFCSEVFHDESLFKSHNGCCDDYDRKFKREKSLERRFKDISLYSENLEKTFIKSEDKSQEVVQKENFYTTNGNNVDGVCSLRGASALKDCQKLPPVKVNVKQKIIKNKVRDVPCTLCTKKFFDNKGLYQHFNAKHHETKLPDFLLVEKASFIHEKIPYIQYPSQFPQLPPYQLKCKICDSIFYTHEAFNNHAKSSHQRRHLCDYCSEVFSKRRLKKRHQMKEHRELYCSYSCQECPLRFCAERQLRNHQRMHRRMNQMMNQRKHQIDIKEPETQPQLSDPEYSDNSLNDTTPISVHPMITRSKKRKYESSHPMTTRNKKKYCLLNLGVREDSDNGEDRNKNKNGDCIMKSRELTYPCTQSFPTQSFPTVRLRNRRMRAQHQEIECPYACQVCHKRFLTENNLLYHQRCKKHQPIRLVQQTQFSNSDDPSRLMITKLYTKMRNDVVQVHKKINTIKEEIIKMEEEEDMVHVKVEQDDIVDMTVKMSTMDMRIEEDMVDMNVDVKMEMKVDVKVEKDIMNVGFY